MGVFVTVFLVFYFVFSSGTAYATVFQIPEIQVRLDVAISTSSSASNLQPGGNLYIRLSKDQTLYIAAIETLTKAGSVGQIVFNQDQIYFEGGVTANRDITDFGAGLEQANGPSGGGLECGTDSKGGTQYPTCKFIFGAKPGHQAQTVKLDEVIFRNTSNLLELSGSDSRIQGIDQQPGSDGKIGRFYFVVYPYIPYAGTTALTNYIVLTGIDGGKTIYVDLYDTQAHAAAAQSQGTPRDVPNYGSATSTGQTSDVGDKLLGLINTVIGFLLGLINEAVFFVFFWFIAPLIQAILSIHVYTDTFVNVIYPGWEVIRNVSNIFFIIALIVIAMATLLRLEAYQFRHLLVQLILAALLVNFSLVIGQSVLALADTVQSQFLPNNTEVIRSLARSLMVQNTRDIVWSTDLASKGYFSTTVSLLFYVSLAIGSFCVFAAIAAFLLIRIVALWIYLMISPIAYAAGALPATTKYRAEWWSGFLKYAFFTPIMAFFLNLTAIISKTVPDVLAKISDNNFTNSNSPSLSNFLFKVASNVILLVFLIAALKVAESFSIVGASTITGWAKKGMFAPFATAGFLAKRGGGYIARRYNEETAKLVTDEHGLAANLKKAAFAVLNPVNFAKGWEQRAKERKEQAQKIAEGAGQEVASELLTFGKEKIPYKELAKLQIENSYVSKLRESMGDDMDKSQAKDYYRRIKDVKGLEGERWRAAYFKLMGSQGYLDDFTEIASDPKFAEDTREGLEKSGASNEALAMYDRATQVYDDESMQTHAWIMAGLDLNTLYRLRFEDGFEGSKEHKNWERKESNQDKLRQLADISSRAKEIGHFEQMYMAVKDEVHGKYKAVVNQYDKGDDNYLKNTVWKIKEDGLKRGEAIKGEMVKVPIRDMMRRITWHNLVPKVKDAKGVWQTGEPLDAQGKLQLSAYQQMVWKTLGPEYISQATHVQPRTIEYTVGKFVKDGQIPSVSQAQYKAYHDLNPQFTEALFNLSTHGTVGPGKGGGGVQTQYQQTETINYPPGTVLGPDGRPASREPSSPSSNVRSTTKFDERGNPIP